MLPEQVGTQVGLAYIEQCAHEAKQMPMLQPKSHCRDAGLLLQAMLHQGKGAECRFCFGKVNIGILQPEMCQLVFYVVNGDAASL